MSTTRKPGRPPGEAVLDPERIVDAAIALVDQAGSEALTMRALAARLGCQPMSLYHHVPSRDALLDAISARLMRDLRIPPPHVGDVAARLRASAHAYQAIARAHPRAFPILALRRFNTPEQMDFLEEFLAMLEGAGVPRADGARIFRMLGFFLTGSGLVWGTLSGASERPAAGLVESMPDRARFPRIASVAATLGPDGFDATFEAGLDAIVAYAERCAARDGSAQ